MADLPLSFPALVFVSIRKGTLEYGRDRTARTRLRTDPVLP